MVRHSSTTASFALPAAIMATAPEHRARDHKHSTSEWERQAKGNSLTKSAGKFRFWSCVWKT